MDHTERCIKSLVDTNRTNKATNMSQVCDQVKHSWELVQLETIIRSQ